MEAGWSARRVGHSYCIVRRCWDQWIRRCHLHEDQAQVALDRPVFEKTATSTDDNRVRVWRPRGEHPNLVFALQRHTAPTASVMPRVLPLIQWLPGAIFQQDNARSHTVRISQDCLFTVTTLTWPTQSPDLSPIEHIWDNLGRRVGHPSSLNELEARVNNRKCKKRATECEGVVVALTLYPSQAPFPANPKRTSPVIDVTLRKPEDGLPLNLFGVPNAFKISITHICNFCDVENKKIIYKCSFWDEKLQKWSLEGIVTYGVVGNVMNCGSSHLTAFAVVETHGGLPTFVIVGIAIAALIGTASVLMLICVFCYKKKTVRPFAS
ncbi:GPS domain-containing protein [Trichonephila clavipes]|nr:GPS domain-containing protein [Trichonephila clavipes]